MGVYGIQAGKELDKGTGSRSMEKTLRTNTVVRLTPDERAAYKRYKKRVKKLGGKAVATPAQYKRIHGRLSKRALARKTANNYTVPEPKMGKGTTQTGAVRSTTGMTKEEKARFGIK